MAYDFDVVIDRRNTNATKLQKYAGSDILPFWIADMDFAVPDFILEPLRERLDHPIIGYDRNEEIIRELQARGFPATREWFAFRCDSHTVNWELVRAGCGIGFGQAGVAEADSEIEEIPIDVNLPVLPVWLATHQALRHSPRIALVWDALAEGMAPHLV